jgi:ribonucleoside-diphosphate reductase alpha chain
LPISKRIGAILVSEEFSVFARTVYQQKYSHTKPDGSLETWSEIAKRVANEVFDGLNTLDLGIGYWKQTVVPLKQKAERYIAERKFVPGGRYLYAAGRPFHQVNNCLLLDVEDSREGWAQLMQEATLALMTGAGIGVVYSKLRPRGAIVNKTGGFATGPCSLMQMVNEAGRGIMQGGSRRSAIWAGLHWNHPDVFEFIEMKNWSEDVKRLKAADYNFPAPMDGTNISVILDTAFFTAMEDESHADHALAKRVYWKVVRQMLETAEPGFSVDCGVNEGENLRNACTELVSKDSSDICNIGSINLARIESVDELRDVVRVATAFLLAGTVYSHVPYEKVRVVREKNRRLGLGLMGVHEWLLQRGYTYDPCQELAEWLEVYQDESDDAAYEFSEAWSITRPVKVRAVAPTGCQKGDTLVYTDDGILTLSELGRVDGEQWQSLGMGVSQERPGVVSQATRFFVNGKAKTKKIKMSSGIELECTPNHRYRAMVGGEYKWVRSDSLRAGDRLVVALNTYVKETEPELIGIRPHYRTESVARMPDRMSPELAWFIGVFCADGSMHAKGIRIACSAKDEDYKKVASVGKALFGVEPAFEDNGRNCLSVYFNSSMLLRWLYTNGLDKAECKEMVVPAVIRCSSRASIASFIEGYWFGDGSESNCRYIDTASSRMAVELVVLSRAVGVDAAINEHISGMGSKMFRVNFVKTKRRAETKAFTEALNKAGLGTCTVDEVVSISDGECDTYDIEVPQTTTYVANGVVSHNTIGIVAETTTGCEPIFAAAYKRQYLVGDVPHYQYVLDPTAKKLVDSGVKPELIEDAYTLASNPERRVRMQRFLQEYVDHGISSTINLPAWGTPLNGEHTVESFGTMLLEHLPYLRGITCYPDGCRAGQPLEWVSYSEAADKVGQVFTGERVDICDLTKQGSCGS